MNSLRSIAAPSAVRSPAAVLRSCPGPGHSRKDRSLKVKFRPDGSFSVTSFAGDEVLPFKEFEFHGFTGKRRTVSFGWRYDFNGGGLSKTEDMPDVLGWGSRACRDFCGKRARAVSSKCL